MKLVIQRVNSASVSLQETGEVTGKIDRGLFVLFGVKKGDSTQDADLLMEKLLKLRVMSDDEGKMNLSIQDVKGSVLVVSQFTLYANTKDGNRPSFIDAAPPDEAKEIYEHFVNNIKKRGVNVQTGRFGHNMLISSSLDGPVTILLES